MQGQAMLHASGACPYCDLTDLLTPTTEPLDFSCIFLNFSPSSFIRQRMLPKSLTAVTAGARLNIHLETVFQAIA
jgi:hypothetical protein